MAPHRPRKSAPIEYATDEEDMITYDVKEEELEPDPTVKFVLKENAINYPKGYLRAFTPTRFRKNRSKNLESVAHDRSYDRVEEQNLVPDRQITPSGDKPFKHGMNSTRFSASLFDRVGKS
ncbi:hypothetical protein TNCV_1770021 [Trichonephila clavipes]|nr:hypothetical protein TNCV_1770021 [Trichonephila clavipes]